MVMFITQLAIERSHIYYTVRFSVWSYSFCGRFSVSQPSSAARPSPLPCLPDLTGEPLSRVRVISVLCSALAPFRVAALNIIIKLAGVILN